MQCTELGGLKKILHSVENRQRGVLAGRYASITKQPRLADGDLGDANVEKIQGWTKTLGEAGKLRDGIETFQVALVSFEQSR